MGSPPQRTPAARHGDESRGHRSTAGAARTWLSWLLSRQTFWVSFAAVLAFVLLSFGSDVFATQQNLFNVTRNFAFVAIIGLGMTAVIITGGIDLSVGAVLALSGMVIGMSMNVGTPFWVAVPLALGASLLVGAFNGVMIALRRHAALRGHPRHAVHRAEPRDGALQQPDGLRVRSRPGPAPGPRRRIHQRGRALPGPVQVPNPVLFLTVMALATGWASGGRKWGRHVFAIGGNEAAANLRACPSAA